jgi:hypothetical protein
MLRTAGGKTAVPLLVQVRGLIANGLLPDTSDCVCCRKPTKSMMRIGLGCEPTPGEAQVRADEAVGCLFGLFTGSANRLAEVATAKIVQSESPDVSVVVPLPVCDTCRPTLDDPAALKQALCHIPEYAALLTQYPNALIHRLA